MASRKDHGQLRRIRNSLITFRNMDMGIGGPSQRMLVCHQIKQILNKWFFVYLQVSTDEFGVSLNRVAEMWKKLPSSLDKLSPTRYKARSVFV